jgi:release factor glutamine methyltransferase
VSTPLADPALEAELVALGLECREARWIVEEYATSGGPDGRLASIAAAHRRLSGEPLQYVIGHWPFRTLDLDLDGRVLIPRPETEELVGVAIDELAAGDVRAPTVLDLGCGSGAIGISVLVELADRGVQASLVAVDVSRGALDVARRNAIKHGTLAVTLLASSWFDALPGELVGRFDLIVSNPPYVSAAEYEVLDDVLRFEPRGAIVADDAVGVPGFAHLDHIITGAPHWLTNSGVLVAEHGESQGAAAVEAAVAAGFPAARTVSDLRGRDRVLVARMS